MNPEVHELTTFELDSAEQKKSGLFSKFFQRFRTSISAAPESPTSPGGVPVASTSSSTQDQYMTFQEYAAARDDDYRSLNRSRRNSNSNPSATQIYSPYIMAKNGPYLSGSTHTNSGKTSTQRLGGNVTTGGQASGANYTQNIIATSTVINGNPNAPEQSATTPTLVSADPETPILNASSMNRRPSVSSIASVNTESSAIVPSWNTNSNHNNGALNNLRSSNANSKNRLLNHVPHFSIHPGSNANTVNTKANPTSINSAVHATASNTTLPTTTTLLSSTKGGVNTNVTSTNSNPAFFASNIRNFPSKNYSHSPNNGNNNNSSGSHQRFSSIHSQNKIGGGSANASVVGSYSNSSISSNATRYSTSNNLYTSNNYSNNNGSATINPGSYHSNLRARANSEGIANHRRKNSTKSDVTLAESLAMSGPTTISTTNCNTMSKSQRTLGSVSNYASPNQSFIANNANGSEETLRRSNSRSSFDSVTSQSSNPDNKRSMKLINMLKNGESKQYWMQDENCKQCYECKTSFNTFRRKHHCRICGQIFCYKCASATISGEKFGYSGTLRVCNYCLKLTQNYRSEQNRSHESYPTSASLASSLTYTMPKTPPVHTSTSNLSIKNSVNAGSIANGNGANSNSNNNLNTNNNSNTNGVENSWNSKYYSVSPDPSYLEQMKRNKANTSNNSIPPYQIHQAHLVRSKSSLAAIEDMDTSMNIAPFTNKNGRKAINASNDTMDQDIVPYITDENGDVVIAGEEDIGEVVDEEWIQSPILSYISNTMIANTNKISNTIVDDAISNPGTPLPSEYYSSDEEDSDLLSVKSMTSLNKIPTMTANKSRDDLHVTFLKNQKRKKVNTRMPSRTQKIVNTFSNNTSTEDLNKTLFKPNNSAISYVLPIEEMNLEDGSMPYTSNLPPSISDTNFNFSAPLMSPHLFNSPSTELIATSGNKENFILPINIELSSESYFHMKHLLYQILYENNCDLNQGWEEILSHMLLKVCDNIRPNINRGDDIDIRKYIKIKKIPGGIPSDSHYVQGIVCSKNVAHKKMVRTIKNPRILLLSFSLEYQRVENQFMSLEPILSQEREHLRILIQRIKNLNPDVVLVEKIVSRIALEYLLEANIVAVYNVKPSVMQYIARYTQADILNSIDKLVLEPKLGTCGVFSVKTFLNDLIPGKKKTFLFFDGCPRDLGGTIVLRGGDIDTLKKIKMITKFMSFVVYNLKLETYLMRDEFAISPEKHDNSCYHFIKKVLADKYAYINTESELDEHFTASAASNRLLTTTAGATGNATTVDDNYSNMENPTSELVETGLTSTNIKTDDDESQSIIQYSSDIDVLDDEIEEGQYTQLYKIFSTRILSCSPHVIFPPPYLIMKKMRVEVNYFNELRKQHGQISDTNSIISTTVSPMLNAKEEITNDEIFITNNYINKFKNTDLVNPFGHLNISYLYRSSSTDSSVPCELIKVVKRTYYSQSDQTLGQYLEGFCKQSDNLCQVCLKPLSQHTRTFIHGNGKVTVIMEDMECPAEAMENIIIMWSKCKICQQITPFVPMSEETWMFSFGKYLELAFYHSYMSCRANSCPHNIVKNHIRCFGYHNKVIKFEYNPIELFEVSLPPMKLRYRPEANLKNKQNDVNTIKQYITKYYNSVSERIKNIYLKYVPSSKLQEAKEEIAGMNRRIVVEKAQMLELLQHTAFASTPSDVLSLNNVVHVLQEKISEYDSDFEAFSQKYFQLDREFNKRIQLKHAFVTKNDYLTVGREDSTDPLMKPSQHDLLINFPELGQSPSESSPLEAILNKEQEEKIVEEVEGEEEENENGIEFDLGIDKSDSKEVDDEEEEEEEMETMSDRNVSNEEDEDGDDEGEEEEEEEEELIQSKESLKDSDSHKFSVKSYTSYQFKKIKNKSKNKARKIRTKSKLIRHSNRYDNDLYSYGKIPMLLMENSFSPIKDHSYFNSKSKSKSYAPMFGSPVDSNYLFMNVISDDDNDENDIAPVEIDKNLLTFKDDDDDRKESVSLKVNTIVNSYSHLIEGTPLIMDNLNTINSLDINNEQDSLSVDKKNNINESPVIFNSPQRTKTDPNLDTSSIYSKNTILESDSKVHESKFQLEEDGEQNSPILEMEYIDSLLVSETADNATTILSDIRPSMPNPTTSLFIRTNSLHKLKRTSSVKDQRLLGRTDLDNVNNNRVDSRHDKTDNEENIFSSPPLSNVDRNAKENNLALTSLEYDLPLDITDVINVTPLTYNNESDNETDTEIEKMSIMKTLSQFWNNSSHFSPLEYPFPPDQHIFRGSLVIVREDEPSSIIAFALNSREYRNSLLQQQQQFQTLPKRHSNSIHSVGHNGSIINALTSYATTTSLTSTLDQENVNTPTTASNIVNNGNPNNNDYNVNSSMGIADPQSGVSTNNGTLGVTNDGHTLEEDNISRGVGEPGNDENKVHKIIDEIIGNNNNNIGNPTDANNIINNNINVNNVNNGIVSEEEERPNNDNESIYKSKTDNHIKCQFMDGSTRIFCKIFYPEKFENLRKNCGVEKIYVQSLSHCLKWSNDGGKSGSAFLKTRDDRFIVKQLSRPEMDAFLKFADEYFEYLNNALHNKTPTSLAKIYGIYRFGIKNPNSGKNLRMDVLVMENLFYDRKCSKIFDLKGSTRNRHAQSTGRENEVLLDENLLELINEQPLFIREYSKNLLFTSVWKDTSFLSQLNVMDYSLVVGVDSETHELITGIVDYIRTFTWDKKLESWVKETGILGGGGKDPTIISPVQYKNRFRESMARYFLMVPDKFCFEEEDDKAKLEK